MDSFAAAWDLAVKVMGEEEEYVNAEGELERQDDEGTVAGGAATSTDDMDSSEWQGDLPGNLGFSNFDYQKLVKEEQAMMQRMMLAADSVEQEEVTMSSPSAVKSVPSVAEPVLPCKLGTVEYFSRSGSRHSAHITRAGGLRDDTGEFTSVGVWLREKFNVAIPIDM